MSKYSGIVHFQKSKVEHCLFSKKPDFLAIFHLFLKKWPFFHNFGQIFYKAGLLNLVPSQNHSQEIGRLCLI